MPNTLVPLACQSDSPFPLREQFKHPMCVFPLQNLCLAVPLLRHRGTSAGALLKHTDRYLVLFTSALNHSLVLSLLLNETRHLSRI